MDSIGSVVVEEGNKGYIDNVVHNKSNEKWKNDGRVEFRIRAEFRIVIWRKENSQ